MKASLRSSLLQNVQVCLIQAYGIILSMTMRPKHVKLGKQTWWHWESCWSMQEVTSELMQVSCIQGCWEVIFVFPEYRGRCIDSFNYPFDRGSKCCKYWAGSDETCIKREENSPLHHTDRGIGCCIHGEYIDCPDGVYGCRMGLRGKGKLLLCVWPIHCFITLQALRLGHALINTLLPILMAPGVVRTTCVMTLQIVLDLELIHICQSSWNLVMALLAVQMVKAMHLAEPVYQVVCDYIHVIALLNSFVAGQEFKREPYVGDCFCMDNSSPFKTVSFECISDGCPMSVVLYVPCELQYEGKDTINLKEITTFLCPWKWHPTSVQISNEGFSLSYFVNLCKPNVHCAAQNTVDQLWGTICTSQRCIIIEECVLI